MTPRAALIVALVALGACAKAPPPEGPRPARDSAPLRRRRSDPDREARAAAASARIREPDSSSATSTLAP